MNTPSFRKKLIEVALPLKAINKASSREKSIRHGHPSTLHLWWARRPLAAARAVIFAQMVDDPSEYADDLLADPRKVREAKRELKKRGPSHRAAVRKGSDKGGQSAGDTEGSSDWQALRDMAAQIERERLFSITEELVRWENTTNEQVLNLARKEIWQSWRRSCAEHAGHPRAAELFDRKALPGFHDPFAGGGALPLEAQRLGLEAHASDLNPVAVLINKAMIEIPPKFADRSPVRPASHDEQAVLARTWIGAQGLAEDVRYYGRWMRDEAEKRIGHLYPQVKITSELVRERPDLRPYEGRKLKVIAWLWARTVKSPNPAFAHLDVPLVSTFMLSTKKGKEAFIEPVIEDSGYRFTVKMGTPDDALIAKKGTKLSRGANFRCLMSGSPIEGKYIKAEGQAKRMAARLMAVVAEGVSGRIYLAPTTDQEETARAADSQWRPELHMPRDRRWFSPPLYGLPKYGDIFTSRQSVALTTFSDLVGEAMEKARQDALACGLPDDERQLSDGGKGARAYAEAVAVYLAFAADKVADYWSSICTWHNSGEKVRNTFGRQAIPMTWDYTEANPFSSSTGNWMAMVDWIWKCVEVFPSAGNGVAAQSDAAIQNRSFARVVSTDPPYYDNIGYADLSDFFYVWLRRTLKPVFPDLFATLAVPKADEMVATPYRHGSKAAAESFFLDGMTGALRQLCEQVHPGFPVTIYYAFKQSERRGGTGISSTGWETFLDAVIRSGFSISGTWPMRTELRNRMIGMGTNALASSIVLVCRRRASDAPVGTRREFLADLRADLPQALRLLQTGNIAPVDLAQAAIGPGMAAYTRYAKVLNAEGNPITVREALAMINQILDEVLAEQEGDFDPDSRWALAWFDHFGFSAGEFGIAETLSKAKNTSVQGMVEAGVIVSRGGTVQLLKPSELPTDWDPDTDTRLTAWEAVHHLVRVLEGDGEESAGVLAAKLGALAEVSRELCYRLYTVCERKKRNEEARAYNGLVQSWPEIMRLSRVEKGSGAANIRRTGVIGARNLGFSCSQRGMQRKGLGWWVL